MTNSIGEGKQLLADEVFHHVASQIIDGRLTPGHRIRDIDVAHELHVSRTPVREALQRLERLGLVTMYPSRYTEVTAVTPDVVQQTLEFAGYQAGAAARMSIARISAGQRTHVAGLVQRLLDSLDDHAATSSARWAVFSYLGEHSGNAQLRDLINDVGVALFRNLRGWRVPDEDHARMTQVYRDFREAVLRGDADESERLTREMHYV